MDLSILRLNIGKETNIEKLREMAIILVKCIATDNPGGGYCVVNDNNPPYSLYTGSRQNCIAFIRGYESAPSTDVGVFDHSVNCVCVDSRPPVIVIPEDRFGEVLNYKHLKDKKS